MHTLGGEKLSRKVVDRKIYNEPTFLVNIDKDGKPDFGILCDGSIEIIRYGNGTKKIICRGKSIYFEPKREDRGRILRIEDPCGRWVKEYRWLP